MIYEILRKYKKYDLEYRPATKNLYIFKPMLVKDFVRLRADIRGYGIKLNNLIITERWR